MKRCSPRVSAYSRQRSTTAQVTIGSRAQPTRPTRNPDLAWVVATPLKASIDDTLTQNPRKKGQSHRLRGLSQG
jgi:hypothetical protein